MDERKREQTLDAGTRNERARSVRAKSDADALFSSATNSPARRRWRARRSPIAATTNSYQAFEQERAAQRSELAQHRGCARRLMWSWHRDAGTIGFPAVSEPHPAWQRQPGDIGCSCRSLRSPRPRPPRLRGAPAGTGAAISPPRPAHSSPRRRPRPSGSFLLRNTMRRPRSSCRGRQRMLQAGLCTKKKTRRPSGSWHRGSEGGPSLARRPGRRTTSRASHSVGSRWAAARQDDCSDGAADGEA